MWPTLRERLDPAAMMRLDVAHAHAQRKLKRSHGRDIIMQGRPTARVMKKRLEAWLRTLDREAVAAHIDRASLRRLRRYM